MTSPWDLATALAHPKAVRPGDVIFVRGGTYSGSFISSLHGIAGHPVVVRGYPSERVILDGAGEHNPTLTVNGPWSWFQGLEVTNSAPIRKSSEAGSHPESFTRPTAIDVLGHHTRFINLIVHDAGQGFGFWSTAVGAEIYGSLIFNNGWDGPDRAHGHGIYMQNAGEGKRVVNNLIFNQFGYGIHGYGSSTSALDNFYIQGNTVFNNGLPSLFGFQQNILVGGGSVAHNPQLIGNRTYWSREKHSGGGNNLGYAAGCENLTLIGNYFALGMTSLVRCQLSEFRDNDIFQATEGFPPNNQGNRITPVPPQSGTEVFVEPNQYEAGRAHVTVFNWSKRPSISAKLAGLFPIGTRFRILDAQNIFGPPLVDRVYDGNAVVIPMDSTTVAQPLGGYTGVVTHTSREFGVFVVSHEKTI